MVSTKICFLLILLVIINKGDANYCPSSEWISCASHSKTCAIPIGIHHATISFGGRNPSNNTKGQWVFTAISNTRNNTFSIDCTGSNFGSVYNNKNVHLGCCYIDSIEGPSLNEGNWKVLAFKGKKYITNKMEYIRYGAFDAFGGVYIYRWMNGEFVCQSSWFGSPILFKNAQPICETVIGIKMTTTKFVECGTSATTECTLQIDGNIGKNESIRLVQYGKYPNFVYRYVYSTDTNKNIACSIPCNGGMFGNPNPNSGTQICSVSNDTVFNGGAIGLWQIVTTNSKYIEYGVTSKNIVSTTKPWQNGVNQTIAAGFTFLGSNFSYLLTTKTSTNVSNSINASYSIHEQKSCAINCDINNENLKIYQWIFKTGEFIGTELQQFEIYSCDYICSSQSLIPPQCPPTYCKPNTTCTQCQGWSTN